MFLTHYCSLLIEKYSDVLIGNYTCESEKLNSEFIFCNLDINSPNQDIDFQQNIEALP